MENSSPVKPKEKKNTSEEVKEQELGPDKTKKTKGKRQIGKKIVSEKGKVQEVEMLEQAQEVSKKRTCNIEMLIKSDGRAQKHICEGSYNGVENLLDETAVAAEQHRRDQ